MTLDTPAPRLRLTILFCTYRRPALLRKALDSVAALDGLSEVDLDLVVADNSDEGSAADVVAEFGARVAFPVRYLNAHPANISVARNAAVAAATGDIVAFLDDDMVVAPVWLSAVREAVATTDRDVYFGPVAGMFEDPARALPEARQMFNRHMQLPLGGELFAMGPHKTDGFALATSNSVFRRARTLTEPAPFDLALGQCGGEDYDLFCRLQRQGRRFGYIPGAHASEFVPAHRGEVDYLARRYFAGGQAYAFCLVKNSESPLREELVIRLKTMVQFVLLALRAPFMNRDTRRIRFSALIGKWRWRQLYPLYRMEENRSASG